MGLYQKSCGLMQCCKVCREPNRLWTIRSIAPQEMDFQSIWWLTHGNGNHILSGRNAICNVFNATEGQRYAIALYRV